MTSKPHFVCLKCGNPVENGAEAILHENGHKLSVNKRFDEVNP